MPTQDTCRARHLRKHLTDAQLHLWQHLRKHQLTCKFRRQVPIGRFVADFACLQARLIIEVDGGQHAGHGNYDRQRDAYLNRRGYRVLRFWNHDVLRDIDVVLEVIHIAIQHRCISRT